jgi:CheY-specific phosphatase CheX
MNTTEFSVRDCIQETVPNVVETMLGFSASANPNPPAATDHDHDHVSGTIGIGGDTVTGAIYIHLAEPLARAVVNAMLGSPADQPVADNDLNDVVGEFTNMVAGGFKSALCNVDRPCAMSTPSIIRGAFGIEVPTDLKAEKFHFLCQGHDLTVEVHLKLD